MDEPSRAQVHLKGRLIGTITGPLHDREWSTWFLATYLAPDGTRRHLRPYRFATAEHARTAIELAASAQPEPQP